MGLLQRWRGLRRGAQRAVRGLKARVKPASALYVYHPQYQGQESALVDAQRAPRILNYLRREGAISPGHLRSPPDVTIAQLARVHSLDYLERLGRPEEVLRICATFDASADPEQLLQQQRRMVAGTVMAAKLAVQPWAPRRPVVNLGGGLHHARAEQGAGFCLFHDVAVAIAQLRARGFGGRIMVIDLDLHQGDGTRAIFARDPTVFTYSLHAVDWDDSPCDADFSLALGLSVGDERYLAALRETLPGCMRGFRPELVFYVGGVDIAEDDRLGSWRVSHDGIFARDQYILERVGALPLVWTLAGGYGPEAWRHSARSLAWLSASLGDPIPSAFDRDLRHFRRIARRLDPQDLMESDSVDFEFSEADVYGTLMGSRARTRLLGYYSRYGVEIALERYGVMEVVRGAGYGRTCVELDLERATGELARLVSDDGRRDVLVEVILKESLELSPFRLLYIEWLLMQDPRRAPSVARPLLPGQVHPGLGALREMTGMLMMACERLGMDGLAFRPAHYHVKALSRTWLRFADPALEARWLALGQALEGVPLERASALVAAGAVVEEASGAPVRWSSELVVMPLSARCREALRGPEATREVEALTRGLRFVLRGA